MVLDNLPPGFSTGLHIHRDADEFFYVISGTGTATLGDQETAIEPGDVVFVPSGSVHKMAVSEEGPMELLFFVDRPGLDEFFREVHALYFSKGEPMSLEECNAIGSKHNMVCITQN